MARKRMVDPEFWLDEQITSLGYEFRLFYIGSWNFADDYGVVENSSKKLKAQIFPYDDDVDCEAMITKLIELKRYIPFEAEGKKWLYVKNFLKYQRVDKPSKLRNPQAPKEVLGEDSTTTQEPLLDEEKRSKEKLSEEKRDNLVSYLEKIPESDLEEFTKKYEVSKSKIKEKGQALFFWCKKKGRSYRNYRMALQDALLKDYGLRKKSEVFRPPEPKNQLSEEARKRMIDLARPAFMKKVSLN